jgi:hypothetical protein
MYDVEIMGSIGVDFSQLSFIKESDISFKQNRVRGINMLINPAYSTQDSEDIFDVILSVNFTDEEKQLYPQTNGEKGWIAPTMWVTFNKKTGNLQSISFADEGLPTFYNTINHNIKVEHIKQALSFVKSIEAELPLTINL